MIKHLEKENFDEAIKDGNCIVDFYADWCGPCKMMAPVLEEIKGIDIIKVNVDEFSDIATKNGIMSIPTLCFYKNGEEIYREIGFKSKEELEGIIKNKLN